MGFDDMERPKFGYMVKLTLNESKPCQIDFENPERSTCILPSNSTKEILRRISSGYSTHYAQSRQTGEEFRSGAPPECRIELCQSETQNTVDESISTVPPISSTNQPMIQIAQQTTPPSIRVADTDIEIPPQVTGFQSTESTPLTKPTQSVKLETLSTPSQELFTYQYLNENTPTSTLQHTQRSDVENFSPHNLYPNGYQNFKPNQKDDHFR